MTLICTKRASLKVGKHCNANACIMHLWSKNTQVHAVATTMSKPDKECMLTASITCASLQAQWHGFETKPAMGIQGIPGFLLSLWSGSIYSNEVSQKLSRVVILRTVVA